jgi:hypothetical protein
VLLVSLVVGVAAGLTGAPFVLGGCSVPQKPAVIVGPPTHDPDTGTTAFSTATADPIVPINDEVVIGAIAASGNELVALDVMVEGIPVPTTDVVPPAEATALENAAIAQGVFDPLTQAIVFRKSVGGVTVTSGDSLSITYRATDPFGPAASPQFSVVLVFEDDLGTAPLPIHFVPNPAAFVLGGTPSFAPQGAVAWKIEHPSFPHTDGPFALPGAPNPNLYPVLDPPQIGITGMYWVGPHAPFCAYWHPHGLAILPPIPHPDPDGGGCGHGALKWLPEVSLDVHSSAPPGSTVFTSMPLFVTGTVSTSGLDVDRTEVYFGGILQGTDPGSGSFEIPFLVPSLPANTTVDLTTIAYDHDDATASATIPLNYVAPMTLNLDGLQDGLALAEETANFTLDITNGAVDYQASLFIQDVLAAQQTGPSPIQLPWTAPSVSTPTAFLARVDVVDGVSQTGTIEFPFTVVPRLGGQIDLYPTPTVPAGGQVSVSLVATGTAMSGTFSANGLPFDSFAGGSGTYPTIYLTAPSPVTTPLQISAELFDSAFSQSATVTAAPLFVIGSDDTIQVVITVPLGGSEVLENTSVPVSGQLMGGYNGLSVARLYADGQLQSTVTVASATVDFNWQANLPGPGIQSLQSLQGEGSSGMPVALTVDAVDSVGQVGTSAPVVVYVLPAGGQIPALGAGALAALTALVCGIGIHAAIRRRAR